MNNSITQLPAILRAYTEANEGSYAEYEASNNLLTRCLIVSQLSISMYHHSFLRKLFAIDCGFWKNSMGKSYKLLLIESTTGNNENCCVAWAIVDGETTDNVDWVLDRLKIAGVDLNTKDVATISDEGKAILKAISNSLPLSFHMTCAKHWLGNHPGKWEVAGNKDNLFWKMV